MPKSYLDLKVWSLSMELAVTVYQLTATFPKQGNLWPYLADATLRRVHSQQHRRGFRPNKQAGLSAVCLNRSLAAAQS